MLNFFIFLIATCFLVFTLAIACFIGLAVRDYFSVSLVVAEKERLRRRKARTSSSGSWVWWNSHREASSWYSCSLRWNLHWHLDCSWSWWVPSWVRWSQIWTRQSWWEEAHQEAAWQLPRWCFLRLVRRCAFSTLWLRRWWKFLEKEVKGRVFVPPHSTPGAGNTTWSCEHLHLRIAQPPSLGGWVCSLYGPVLKKVRLGVPSFHLRTCCTWVCSLCFTQEDDFSWSYLGTSTSRLLFLSCLHRSNQLRRWQWASVGCEAFFRHQQYSAGWTWQPWTLWSHSWDFCFMALCQGHHNWNQARGWFLRCWVVSPSLRCAQLCQPSDSSSVFV